MILARPSQIGTGSELNKKENPPGIERRGLTLTVVRHTGSMGKGERRTKHYPLLSTL